jgi:hypothetical protein
MDVGLGDEHDAVADMTGDEPGSATGSSGSATRPLCRPGGGRLLEQVVERHHRDDQQVTQD